MHRYCKINRIGDEHILKVKDFVIFDDAFLTEWNRYLIDENTGMVYEALYYTTIEEDVLECPEVMPWANGWRKRKRTAIKFDKCPPLNAKLYIKRRGFREEIKKTEVIE